ncbi:MAG TPA: ABC transporter ATP-binding protein [Mycobacteriales bacterium]
MPHVAVVRGLAKSYGATRALDGVDLDVARGEVFGLLGPNGAGKTTFVRCLMGLLKPDAGTVTMDGEAAYLGQDDAALADLTPALAVELTGRLRGLGRRAARQQAGEILDELGVRARGPVGRMSGGERRLAGVATALAGDRDVLVLDEPTTGLDPVARRAVWAALDRRRARGATVVLVTHNVVEAETVLDRVAVFDGGRVIACDSPGRLKASVSDEVRLDLVWRADPPADPTVDALRAAAVVTGRRWSVRLSADAARDALGRLTGGPAFAALDDFTLATPSLEDVYLALGGRAADLEHA